MASVKQGITDEKTIETVNDIQRYLYSKGITAGRLLKRGGSSDVTQARKDLTYTLRDSGMTTSRIAIAIGVDKSMVQKYLNERRDMQGKHCTKNCKTC